MTAAKDFAEDFEDRRSTLSQAAQAEIEAAQARGELDCPRTAEEQLHTRIPVHRCHVCWEVESKNLVNKLAAQGFTNREIVEACSEINSRRKAGGDHINLITANSVRKHVLYHFGIHKPAQAAYRRILERRAAEANLDYVNGVENIVTEYALIETVMAKGYATVTADDTVVSVDQAVNAAKILHDMQAKDASNRKMADMIYALDRMIRAAQEFVPEELQEAFMARVEGRSIVAAIEGTVVESEAPVREFIPARHDEGDEFSA